MELSAILLILALVLLVVFFVSRPFLERHNVKLVSAEEHQVSALLAERDRLITTLQELDFDHTLGKIPAEDYPTMRAQLLQQAADVLRQLDQVAPARAKSGSKHAAAEDRIEAEVAARREDAAIRGEARPTAADEEDQLEERIAARRSARKEKSAGFCSKCGKPLFQSDKFCPACGNPS